MISSSTNKIMRNAWRRIVARLFLLIVVSVLFAVIRILPAGAARLYFEPQELTIGTDKEFSVVVNIDSAKPVNAFQAAVVVPPELTAVDTSEGNSIINLWVDKPQFDELTRLLTFSGIVPGGWQGAKAPLLLVKFKTVKQVGEAILDFKKEQTKVYLHSPDGIEDSLQLDRLVLPIAKGKENMGAEIIDYDPPEDFKPEVSRQASVFGGKWFLAFATQDKSSGMYRFQVLETRSKEPGANDKGWAEAESPYQLKDQKLSRYVFVKAVDKAGNERMAVLPPLYPQRRYANYWIFAILMLVAACAYLVRRGFYAKNRQK